MNNKFHYSNERNAQIVIALLKANNIKKIVASPGSTNISFVGSVQNDSYFEVYSSVDERSAAYLACGLAAESDEPVVLSCTGATASRNYLSGLTEAYYRKLPIIAVTSTHEQSMVGNLIPQVIDRSVCQNDVAIMSVQIPTVKHEKDDWDCQIKVNRALSAIKRNGGGPVHLNLETANVRQPFSVEELKDIKVIQRYTIYDELPEMPKGRIGIFVGSHKNWSKSLTEAVDKFCEVNNAVVFCDHTSGYEGKYKIMAALLGSQDKYRPEVCMMYMYIRIGEISGSYEAFQVIVKTKNMWRVSEDGEIKDPLQDITKVFDMPELEFFKHYSANTTIKNTEYYEACKSEYDKLYNLIPELPFSNLWVAKNAAVRIPAKTELHLGILNSLRSWNFFEISKSVRAFSNVGGFGIDGGVSSLVGASLCYQDKIYYGVFGDLAFFYDLNVLGNRHVGNNVRIILINNGKGVEFRNYTHQAALWGDKADEYIAAGGHFGKQSHSLIKNFAVDLGYEYLTASNKEECISCFNRFFTEEKTDKPMIFEVFTKTEDEVQALYLLRNMVSSPKEALKQKVSGVIKEVAGENALKTIKKIIKYK